MVVFRSTTPCVTLELPEQVKLSYREFRLREGIEPSSNLSGKEDKGLIAIV
jgi:hypothetical protein